MEIVILISIKTKSFLEAKLNNLNNDLITRMLETLGLVWDYDCLLIFLILIYIL